MTRIDVRKKIGEIAENLHDNEHAHKLEDRLFKLVISAIAKDDTDDAMGLCIEALKVDQMEFTRWYA